MPPQKYLSTDPNAGDEASGKTYLSTDPSAGDQTGITTGPNLPTGQTPTTYWEDVRNFGVEELKGAGEALVGAFNPMTYYNLGKDVLTNRGQNTLAGFKSMAEGVMGGDPRAIGNVLGGAVAGKVVPSTIANAPRILRTGGAGAKGVVGNLPLVGAPLRGGYQAAREAWRGEPFKSTMRGGPQGGTTPAPPYRILEDVPDSPNARGGTTPAPPYRILEDVPDSPNARGGTTPAPEPRPTPEVPDSPNATGSVRWEPERQTPPPAEAAPSPPANAPTLRKGTPESRARATMTVDDALDQALKDSLGEPATAAKTPATPAAEASSPMMSQMEDSILIQKAKQTHRPPAKDHPIWKRVQQVRDADGVDGAAREFDIPQKWVEQNTTAGGKLPTNKATQLSERLEQMTREEAIAYYNKANPAKPTPFSSHIKEWLESKGWL